MIFKIFAVLALLISLWSAIGVYECAKAIKITFETTDILSESIQLSDKRIEILQQCINEFLKVVEDNDARGNDKNNQGHV